MLKSMIAAVGALSALAAGIAQAEPIKVGGKNFTEQLLLTEMTVQLLNAKGYETEKIDGMGSAVLRKAQVNGQVDVYWEYTGTSLVTYNKVKEALSAEETYARVKELDAKQGLVWLNASAANNTYALAVRKADADAKDLHSLTDLAAAYNADKEVRMGVNAEFPKRPDGLIGLQKHYGFKAGRKNLAPMDSGLVYQALKEGKVDVGLVFATDGRIAAFDFMVLQDDKGFFPAYALAPVIRKAVLDAHPDLADSLNAVSAKLDDATMQALNARVDVNKETIEAVAESFLKEQGLI